jgi:hypothetical protein
MFRGVEGNMRDRGHELFLRQAVLESLLEMELDLLDTVQRDENMTVIRLLSRFESSGRFQTCSV